MWDASVLALMNCRAIDIDISGGEEKTQFGPPTFYDRFAKLERDLAEGDGEAKPDEMEHGTAVQ